jgi:hypothetical protein
MKINKIKLNKNVNNLMKKMKKIRIMKIIKWKLVIEIQLVFKKTNIISNSIIINMMGLKSAK